jgi:hypothetical protein
MICQLAGVYIVLMGVADEDVSHALLRRSDDALV